MPREHDPEATDSAMKSRPIFHTDAGRVVRGGGGIVPDIVIRPDTLTEGEREFAKALGTDLPIYRDVLTDLALEAKTTSTRSRPSASRSRRRCGRRSTSGSPPRVLQMKPEVFDGGGRLVDEQLGYEIARYVFGRPAEFRRRARRSARHADGASAAPPGPEPQGPARPGHGDAQRAIEELTGGFIALVLGPGPPRAAAGPVSLRHHDPGGAWPPFPA